MSNRQDDSEAKLAPVKENSLIELVEIEPGVAVLFADQLPTDLDLVPFATTDKISNADLINGLSLAIGAGSMALQAAQSTLTAQGLVRLDPSTLEMLKTATPMISEGKNLGALVGDSGKIVSLIRYSPAMDAQAALMATQVGPLAPLLMVQAQLMSISRQVDENIKITQSVVELIRKDQWQKLKANHKSLLRAVEEARSISGVNNHTFKKIAHLEPELIYQKDKFTAYVEDHVLALRSDVKGRRNYVQKNLEAIIADTHGMLMAEGSWYRWCVLRAANIIRDPEDVEENKILLANHVFHTKTTHSEAMNNAHELITELERQCRLMNELPGSFFTRGPNKKDAVKMANALSEKLSELRNQLRATPDLVKPEVVFFKKEVPKEVLRVLQWILPDAGPLFAFADVSVQRRIGEKSYLGITPKHLLLSPQNLVRKQGIIEESIPLEDIRYIRFRTQAKQGPELDIITKDEDYRIRFDDWGATGEGLIQAERLHDLLATVMSIPESEKRTDPLMLFYRDDPKELTK